MKTPEKNYFPEIKRESDLYEPLRKLFMLMYDTEEVEVTNAKGEEWHGCDLILEINRLSRIGFQIKTTTFTQTTLTKEFMPGIRNAAAHRFGIGKIKRLSQFIWITTKPAAYRISEAEIEKITDDLKFERPMEIWEGKQLYDEFRKYYPGAFINIKIDSLCSEAEEQSEKGNHIFAAHYLFRVFILQLLQSNVSAAKEVIHHCISHIDQQTNKSVYFYRSLKRFYEIWKDITQSDGFEGLVAKYREPVLQEYKKTEDEYDKNWCEYSFLMQLVHDDATKKFLESRGMESSSYDYNFLCDFQYIFAQLQILFHVYADSPAGLSSKQVCRTLLRFGFPPTEKLAARISRMKDELAAEEHRSVDGECSLCTGIVLSCFVLANENTEDIQPLKLWLEGLDSYRYSCKQVEGSLDPADAQIALHYAAPVLEAFVDCGDAENSSRVLEHFFGSEVGDNDFYSKWMMDRNISSLEVCAYIFSAFHRYLLGSSDDFRFNHTQSQFVRRAIEKLVHALNEEATPHTRIARLYATRENIQSLCVGLLIGEKELTLELLRTVVQSFRRRAKGISKDDRPENVLKNRSLLDSNVDRTTRFIEGWVAYWETIFFFLDDAPEFRPDGTKMRKTVQELKEEGYLPNYNVYDQAILG